MLLASYGLSVGDLNAKGMELSGSGPSSVEHINLHTYALGLF